MFTGILSAWQGWLRFTDAGKLPAVLLVMLLWMILGRKTRGAQTRLVYYGAGAAFLCIFPVTAMILMKYQTAFYDYPFIWNLVPMTILIALGGTLFLTNYWKKSDGGLGYRSLLYNTFLTLMCAAVLTLCGSLGKSTASGNIAVREDPTQREEALRVLAEAEELAVVRMSEHEAVQGGAGGQEPERSIRIGGHQTEICMWAPAEILTWARTQNSEVTLLYGRNMWDPALNAYSYDVYPEELKRLYRWMEGIEEPGGKEDAYTESKVREHVVRAFALGAECILLPKELLTDAEMQTAETRQKWVAWDDHVEWTELDRYYLLVKVD